MTSVRLTILLTALLLLNMISGFLTVVCHGSDGHIVLELADHKGCPCPSEPQGNLPPEPLVYSEDICESPVHCKDYIASSSLIEPSKEDGKRFFLRSLTAAGLTPPAAAAFLKHYPLSYDRGAKPPCIGAALKTIIIIA